MSDGQSVDKGDAKLILGNPQQDLPTNVRIFTFGYGCDHSSCLADLASAGNGKVFSVHDIIYFPAPLADCLGSIVGVAFQKLSMHVSTAAGATMPDIHVPKTWHDDDGCIHTEVGALPNRLKHDILFDFLLSPQKVGLQFLTVATQICSSTPKWRVRGGLHSRIFWFCTRKLQRLKLRPLRAKGCC